MSKLLDRLNPSQREAVTHTIGPLLIIAGPGSGKTRTIVHSIAYAIENGVQPDRILAFSFTGKACEELRERVTRFVGQEEGQLVNISTFHSFCRGVLREDIQKLHKGYTRNFKELKAEDQKKEIRKQIGKVLAQINHLQHHKFFNTKDILDFITRCKLHFILPPEAGERALNPEMPPEISRAYIEIYERYESVLETNKWIDYANQLLLANELLRDVDDVKTKWQEKFELIFVDEYQDTNRVQYSIIKTLAEKHQNLRVVGDDDQGIYSFQGADIQNILNFEKTAKIISLGQNYRSTQKIVDASRALAEFNPDRRDKDLFTQNLEGEKVKHLQCKNEEEEVTTITSFIIRAIRAIRYGWSSKDFAILCRLNSQIDEFKTAFNALGISPDNVPVMTIHKSKGLEFPNVFVVGVCKDLLPLTGNDQNEERRLLYVAMTRAQNWLCLSSYEGNASLNVNGRSPFLDEIPQHFLEPTQFLSDFHIPLKPIKSEKTESSTVVEELLDSTTLSPIRPEIVLGIDPGKIDAIISGPNVGWAVTEKSSNGYTVVDCDTERPKGASDEKFKHIEDKINKLIALHSPDAIAVERLEGATDSGLIGVAGCVGLVRSIANQHGIEYASYSPQQVKYAATGNRKALKKEQEQVQEGVKRRCNFPIVQNIDNIDDHSADAIAVSLCYLDSYLNSSRLQWKKRKQEHYESGFVYLGNGQYDAAVIAFKEAINIDPFYTEAHCGLGRAYFGQNKLIEAENSANKALRFDPKYQSAQELLNTIKQEYYKRGVAYIEDNEYGKAINLLLKASNIEPNDKKVYTSLGRAYYWQDDYTNAASCYQKAVDLDPSDKTAYSNLGNAHYWIGAYAKARSSFQKAKNIDPNCEKTRYYLARTYLELGELEKAKSLCIASTYQSARELLSKLVKIEQAIPTDMILIPAAKFQTDSTDKETSSGKNSRRLDNLVAELSSFPFSIDFEEKVTTRNSLVQPSYTERRVITMIERNNLNLDGFY
ncbi:AAA family ATPase, partial [Candidatus Poribacteria bacterium]|nr:AAA family ATPase [Candidatus Poribacteria bacterium]